MGDNPSFWSGLPYGRDGDDEIDVCSEDWESEGDSSASAFRISPESLLIVTHIRSDGVSLFVVFENIVSFECFCCFAANGKAARLFA